MKYDDIIKFAEALRSETIDVTDNVLVQCPFAKWTHASGKDGTPSMSILVNDYGDSKYHCFGCKEEGSDLHTMVWTLLDRGYDPDRGARLIEIIEKAERNLDEFTAEWEDVRKVKPIISILQPPPPELVYPESELDKLGAQEYHPYLKSRGVLPETAELFDIRYHADKDRVVLPVRWHTGELVGASGRGVWGRDHYNYWKFQKANVLFGEHLLREEPVIVTEGEYDTVKAVQAGFNSVSVMGAKFSPEQVDKLVEWGQPVVICFDPDEAGREQAERLYNLLSRRGVPVTGVEPPEEKDLGKMSSKAIQDLLNPTVVVGTTLIAPDYWG